MRSQLHGRRPRRRGRPARGPGAARGRSRGRPHGRQAVGAQGLGAHVAAREQQPHEPAPRGAIAVGRRHAGYAAKVTVTVATTVGGIWQRWRLRVPTRLRLPVALSVLNTVVWTVPQKRSGPKRL